MEKPPRHFLTGADFGEGPILGGIKIDGESLLLRAQCRRCTRSRSSALIYSHECVFEPQLILADVRFFAAMKLEAARALLPVKQNMASTCPDGFDGMAVVQGRILDMRD